MAFQPGHDAQRLRIVVKAAIGRHQDGERILSGMAKGRVAKVMGQRHRFGQIGIQAKHTRDGARDLCHLDRMGKAGAVIIALMLDKDLGLVLEPPKGRGMDDPVAVALPWAAKGGHALGPAAAAAFFGLAGIGCRHIVLHSLRGVTADPIFQG